MSTEEEIREILKKTTFKGGPAYYNVNTNKPHTKSDAMVKKYVFYDLEEGLRIAGIKGSAPLAKALIMLGHEGEKPLPKPSTKKVSTKTKSTSKEEVSAKPTKKSVKKTTKKVHDKVLPPPFNLSVDEEEKSGDTLIIDIGILKNTISQIVDYMKSDAIREVDCDSISTSDIVKNIIENIPHEKKQVLFIEKISSDADVAVPLPLHSESLPFETKTNEVDEGGDDGTTIEQSDDFEEEDIVEMVEKDIHKTIQQDKTNITEDEFSLIIKYKNLPATDISSKTNIPLDKIKYALLHINELYAKFPNVSKGGESGKHQPKPLIRVEKKKLLE